MGSPINPIVRTDEHTGAMIRAWFEYDTGTSGQGTVKLEYLSVENAAKGIWSSASTLKDGIGTNIAVADGGWGDIDKAHSSLGHWSMAITVQGETSASDWISNQDPPVKWIRVS